MPRKLIFICYKRPELSAQEFAAQWDSQEHNALVEQIPGLVKVVHNYVGPSDAPDAPDGLGELWFETDDALEKAANSPEMGAAAESAGQFLDMERTYAVPATEATIIG
jgi:uncharacterized protein (TIGR02118 family)